MVESVSGPLRESVTTKVGSEAIRGPSREESVLVEAIPEPGTESISDSIDENTKVPLSWALAEAPSDTVIVRNATANTATTVMAKRLALKFFEEVKAVFMAFSFHCGGGFVPMALICSSL